MTSQSNPRPDTGPPETAPGDHRRIPPLAPPHTYRQIARIFSATTGTHFDSARVRQMCLAAEAKFSRAALADPVLSEWLRGPPAPARRGDSRPRAASAAAPRGRNLEPME